MELLVGHEHVVDYDDRAQPKPERSITAWIVDVGKAFSGCRRMHSKRPEGKELQCIDA